MKVSRKDGTTNEGSEGDDTSRTEQEIKKFLGHVDTKWVTLAGTRPSTHLPAREKNVVLHYRFVSRRKKSKKQKEKKKEKKSETRLVERVGKFSKNYDELWSWILRPYLKTSRMTRVRSVARKRSTCLRWIERERKREREKGGTRAGRFKAVETYRARNSRRKRLKAGVFKKKREKGRGKKEKTKRLKRKKKEDGGVDSKKGKSKQKVRFRKEEIFIRKKLKTRNV